MDSQLYADGIRFVHILAVCAGLGTSILADIHAASRLRQRIDDEFLELLHRYHQVVVAALVVMWASGLVIIGMKTGFDAAQMTPKLVGKVITVTLLTINAWFIAAKVMPILKNAIGQRILDLSRRQRFGMGLIGGISTASWMLALAMGVSKFLAASPAETFVYLMPIAYAACVLGALCVLVTPGPSAVRQYQPA
ncbi:hypothetical protein [Roseovarius mucosus]|uniref:hypothetical protein n=1 Tax=Roseovarius mucosus TaxID=215743 RepID=UPI003F71961C